MAEFRRALDSRGLRPERFRIVTEIGMEPPDSYSIEPGRITGGDLRGLMYGLLAAAEQIRYTGRLSRAKGSPRTSVRGIRCFLHNRDLESGWYYSREYWDEYFAMLARNRFNRFNLVFAHQTDYLAPPYPFWIELPDFPEIRAIGLTAAERGRNLEMLRYISQAAAEHGIDFTLGIWEHNIQDGMRSSVAGITRENIGPYSYAALKRILQLCPAIRSVQMRTNSESGIPDGDQIPFYRDYVFRAIAEAGRRVVLDLRGWAMAKGMIDAARAARAPLRVSTKYWAEDLGRPYQPAETYPGYSYLNLLEKPHPYDFFWEIWALGSHRLLLWGDPDFVRRISTTFDLGGGVGFEIDPPLAQKGFGNRPGKWGVFTAAHQDRMFWKHEFERYWMFYLLWGRLSYDPRTPETVWMSELGRRFGPAAADVMEAYRQASRVLSTIVAAHLADPNMYIWPEINPGGLVDAYRHVLPSDWRCIASIPEAARNRLNRIASAKQTPQETSSLLDGMALAVEQAVARAAGKLPAGHPEWRSSQPDFLVLASLARYHARKQKAAAWLEWFDSTGDAQALKSARLELTAALSVWEGLVRLTDGLYPAEMAFGPDDAGHWKDKLPYVRHDLELVREREEALAAFGRFDFGFDFGAAPSPARGPSYRNDLYVRANTVAPRFRQADAATRYSEETGFGWITDGRRETAGIPLTPYHEVRAVAPHPRQLPRDVLYRDYIRGQDPEQFRVKSGPGRFTVSFLYPDRAVSRQTLDAVNGMLDIPFPSGEWSVSGLVIARNGQEPPVPMVPLGTKRLPRPALAHTPPLRAEAGKPLVLALKATPSQGITAVRLHYRPVNQLARFQTLEASPPRFVFTIPGLDISPSYDLMYYFEVLNTEGGGWLVPDPETSTPYFVAPVAPTP